MPLSHDTLGICLSSGAPANSTLRHLNAISVSTPSSLVSVLLRTARAFLGTSLRHQTASEQCAQHHSTPSPLGHAADTTYQSLFQRLAQASSFTFVLPFTPLLCGAPPNEPPLHLTQQHPLPNAASPHIGSFATMKGNIIAFFVLSFGIFICGTDAVRKSSSKSCRLKKDVITAPAAGQQPLAPSTACVGGGACAVGPSPSSAATPAYSALVQRPRFPYGDQKIRGVNLGGW